MSKFVRVLFYYSSMQARQDKDEVTHITRRCSSSASNLIEREQHAGEKLARGALNALYGDKISHMDIITATLQLRTVEGLDALDGRLVMILDADVNQVKRLVKEYAFPKDCCDTQVVFLTSWIDADFKFQLKELRDTSKNEDLENAVKQD